MCPEGIDLYYDNVGGEILDICLAQLALRGRIVLCGAISVYNDDRAGPRARRTSSTSSSSGGGWRASCVLDYLDRFPEAQIGAWSAWLAEGR